MMDAYLLSGECRKADAGTELTVEKVSGTVARIRQKEALKSSYTLTDQLVANVMVKTAAI
jgi:hypothetical protein